MPKLGQALDANNERIVNVPDPVAGHHVANKQYVDAAVGSGSNRYVHTQGVPQATWTIVHNLGGYPAVTIVDSTGQIVFTDITYPNPNTVISTAVSAFSGQAFLS